MRSRALSDQPVSPEECEESPCSAMLAVTTALLFPNQASLRDRSVS